MSAPTIAPATWAPAAPSRLVPDALADARTQLAAAKRTDVADPKAVAASHAALQGALHRVLWVLNEEAGS